MKKTLTLLILALLSFNAYSQNILVINSSYQKYDFSQLDTYIENNRIICLGESEHGVETFSDLKKDFIKYLHSNFNFEVVAFEVGLFDLSSAYLNIENDTLAVKSSFFTIWQTPSILNLYNYSKSTQNSISPLHLTGFDIKSNKSDIGSKWLSSLFVQIDTSFSKYIFKTDTVILNSFEEAKVRIYKSLRGKGNQSIPTLSNKKSSSYIKFYSEILDSLKKHKTDFIATGLLTEHQYKIVYQSVLNRIHNTNFLSINEYYNANSYRDSIMSENIKWIAENLYENKKIILWAGNAHVSKSSEKCNEYLSSIATLPEYLKTQVKSISVDFVSNAPRQIKREMKSIDANVFYIDKPNHLNTSFDGVFYIKNTESYKKYILK